MYTIFMFLLCIKIEGNKHIKKLLHKMVNSATHEIRKQSEELKSQILKTDAEIRVFIQQMEMKLLLMQINKEIISKIAEKELQNNELFYGIENFFFQIMQIT